MLHTCVRPGSLDSAISDEVPNDFAAFFKTHPHINALFFNGQKARQTFKKHVAPSLDINTLPLYTLPSTSPANASWSFERKLESWQSIMDYL
ncbi:MAG: hypothetical protein R3D66_06100 [Alphaproteobacteria bacterium]